MTVKAVSKFVECMVPTILHSSLFTILNPMFFSSSHNKRFLCRHHSFEDCVNVGAKLALDSHDFKKSKTSKIALVGFTSTGWFSEICLARVYKRRAPPKFFRKVVRRALDLIHEGETIKSATEAPHTVSPGVLVSFLLGL